MPKAICQRPFRPSRLMTGKGLYAWRTGCSARPPPTSSSRARAIRFLARYGLHPRMAAPISRSPRTIAFLGRTQGLRHGTHSTKGFTRSTPTLTSHGRESPRLPISTFAAPSCGRRWSSASEASRRGLREGVRVRILQRLEAVVEKYFWKDKIFVYLCIPVPHGESMRA